MTNPEKAVGRETVSQEIKRKFLIDENNLPGNLGEVEFAHIWQGYLAIDDEAESEVRIRQKDDKFTLTTKTDGGLVRGEAEISLSEDQFASLACMVNGRVVEKTRYNIPFGEHLIKLDVFEGVHDGLVVAKVEFDTGADANNFQQPAWFGREVTEHTEYRNQELARNAQSVHYFQHLGR